MLNDLIFSANVVLPIFFLIIIGYALTKLRVWDANFLKVANNLCFKVLLPVLLFYNVASANIFEVFKSCINDLLKRHFVAHIIFLPFPLASIGKIWIKASNKCIIFIFSTILNLILHESRVKSGSIPMFL